MTALPSARWYTVDEYLRIENDSTNRHEFRDGQILAMAGGSPEHSLIATNVSGELRTRLKGKPCRVYGPDLRVRVQPEARYCYPDATVICGDFERDARDKLGTSATNPRLVVEVLSPSTQDDDRGEKFDRYRALPSLREYVLVAQDKARAEAYYRSDDGTWVFDAAVGVEATLKLKSLGIDLPLAEVYAGVDLPPVVEPADEVKPT